MSTATAPTTAQSSLAVPVADMSQYLAGLKIPDLINGDAETISPAPPSGSVQAKYHWVILRNATRSDPATKFLGYYRATAAAMLLPSVSSGAIAADVTTAIATEAKIVAAARASITAAFSITSEHINADERVAEVFQFSTSGDEVRVAAQGEIATRATVAANTANSLTLTAADGAAIVQLSAFAIVLPVLAGWSLTTMGHHYLTGTSSEKGYIAAWRQAEGRFPDLLKNRFNLAELAFRDILFHKVSHPLNMQLKRKWAQEPKMKKRIEAAGFPAAAVRLPATPSEAAIAKAGKALILKATNVLEGVNIIITTGIVDDIIRDLENARTPEELQAAIAEAIEWGNTNEAVLALCAGVVQNMSMTTGVGSDSTTRAYSIKKIMMARPGEVSNGMKAAQVAADNFAKALASRDDSAKIKYEL